MKSYQSKIKTFEAALSLVFWGIVAAFVIPLALISGAISNNGLGVMLMGGFLGLLIGYVIASFVTGIAYVLLDINQKLGASPVVADGVLGGEDEDESQMSDREKALKRFSESKGYE